MKFKGKTIIITGGASGIGRATALEFAAQGANVVVADIDEKHGTETVELIEKDGGSAVFQKTDVSQEEDVQKMVARAVMDFGSLDFAFNNAGIAGLNGQVPHQLGIEQWQKIIDVNLTGVFLCLKHEIEQLLKQESGGVIVNTSSVAGKRGYGMIDYSASKHGVMGLTKSFANVYAPHNIRVCAINPAFIDTPILEKSGIDRSKEHHMKALNNNQPLGRMGTSEEVAKCVSFLCSDDASFLTGLGLDIDGGMLA